jgi:hypothetical protein
MTSAYLKGVQTAHPHARSCSYLGVRLRPSCSDVGTSQVGTVDDSVLHARTSQLHYHYYHFTNPRKQKKLLAPRATAHTVRKS